jgi:hypothetical protein
MTVHKDFADWYRAASVTPSAELLDARWKGVEALASTLDGPTLSILLKLYAVRPGAGYKAPEFLDAAFRGHDSTFPNRDNSEELRVLAGAILRQAVEIDGRTATSAALGIVSSSFGSRRETLPSLDHLWAAEEYLANKGGAVREIKTVPQVRATQMTKEKFEELMPAAIFSAGALPAIRDPLLNTFADHTNRNNLALGQLNTSLWRVIQAQREELNMLWWLQTKASRDLEQPFSKIARPQASIVLPMELADLTIFLPGPSAVLGLIVAALELTPIVATDATAAEAVNAAPRDWRERRVAQLQPDVAELCPISLALARSLDTDGTTEWLPVFRKQCDVKIEVPAKLADIATQLYNERLFLRALAELKK